MPVSPDAYLAYLATIGAAPPGPRQLLRSTAAVAGDLGAHVFGGMIFAAKGLLPLPNVR